VRSRLFLYLIALLLGGCGWWRSPQDILVTRPDAFFPPLWKHPNARLTVSSITIDGVKISMDVKGPQRTLTLFRHGKPLEKEIYNVTTEKVELVEIPPGQRFDPPIPLLWENMRAGEVKKWKGKLTNLSPEVTITADISAARTPLVTETGPAESVHVRVVLLFDDRSPRPAERVLNFWFVKEEGPIKRDFGAQIREPGASAPPSGEPKP
jgi:hypothetical protein